MIYYFKPKSTRTGANLYYSYTAQLLSKYNGFSDFNKFLLYLKNLKEKDVVVNTLAYAQLFHYFRERYNLKFRIIRDVQTSLHASYLLQEMLVSDWIRKGDIVLFPSNFTRNLYIKLFKHINKENSFVCYPILKSFPKLKKGKKLFKYGYIGKIAPEKNFDSIIDLALRTKEKILVAGESRYPKTVFPKNIIWLGKINEIWDFYNKIEILLFPSTANIESLGRVLLEANQAGIKCITANHGASPELCPNLLKVKYKNNIELVHNHALGRINEKEILNMKNLKLGNNNHYENHEQLFLSIINNKAKKQEIKRLNKNVENFIKKSKIIVNTNFSHQKIYILKEIINKIKTGDLEDIGNFNKEISNKINFIPKWKIKP